MIIVSREDWGARHDRGFRDAPLPASEIWLHHSVTAPPPSDPAKEAAAMRQIEQIGEDRFGGGVSYTFAIAPSGRIYEGHGVDRQGAHTGGHNTAGRGIVLMGNHEVVPPTSAQLNAVAELLVHGRRAGWWDRHTLSGGHRDASGASTACPGRFAHAQIGEVNRRAAGLYAAVLAPPVPQQPAPGPVPIRPGGVVHPVLSEGMRNHPLLRNVQAFLRRVFPSYAGRLVVDGDYGPATRAVVREFQRRTGITGPDANGSIIGPRTWAQLVRHGYQ